MKKVWTVILIVALSLIVAGGVVFVVALGLSGWDIRNMSNVSAEEKTFTEDTPLDSISVDFDNAEIRIVFDETADAVRVDYPLLFNKSGKALNQVTVTQSDGRVTITEKTFWRANIGFGFTSPEVRLTLPQSRVYTLSGNTDNGKIVVEGNGNVSALSLETDNGAIDTTAATFICHKDIRLSTDNGQISLGEFSAENLYAETDNGEIRFTNGNATGKIEASTDNGRLSVTGTLTAQTIGFETDTGEIAASNGLLCANSLSLKTDVGAIRARVSGNQADYTISVKKDVGNSNVTSQQGGDKRLNVSVNVGEIRILFD